MNLKTLSSEGKIAYLIKPILKVLQEAGGQLERAEIKERIADMDEQIAEYSEIEKKSKKIQIPKQAPSVLMYPSWTTSSTINIKYQFTDIDNVVKDNYLNLINN